MTRAATLPPERWLWDELLSVLSFTSINRQNLLSYSYWSMGAFRHGDYIAKIRTVPTKESVAGIAHLGVNVSTDLESFRNTLVAELGERDTASTCRCSSACWVDV